jgi:hypothetical protein
MVLPVRKNHAVGLMVSVAIGTRHDLAYVGDLKTLCVKPRSQARTSNP